MCTPGAAPWATESLREEEADTYQQREQLLGAASIGRLIYFSRGLQLWTVATFEHLQIVAGRVLKFIVYKLTFLKATSNIISVI